MESPERIGMEFGVVCDLELLDFDNIGTCV
jgi:hypothetical protein